MSIKDLSAIYAGAQLQAAGILFLAKDTGNVLVVYRGEDVVDPCCWCGVGGKIEHGENPSEAARREASEEIGFNGEYLALETIYTFESEELKFHNFIGLVEEQFFPKLNWESDGYAWVKPDQIPTPTHYGLQAILNDAESMKVLARLTSA